MAVNKVEYGDTTLIDLTSDTVTKETLLIGATAHTASGESISGEFDPEIYLRKSGGDTTNNIVTFTSGDSSSPTAWTDVNSLVTGEKHSSLLNKISTMIKNVRFLYKVLGTTDISTIGDGTVTGAVSTLNSSLNDYHSVNIGTKCKATRIGNLVHIYSTGWALLDSLPIGYRPIAGFYFVISNQSKNALFNHVNIDGKFEDRTTQQIFSVTFFTNDPMPQ